MIALLALVVCAVIVGAVLEVFRRSRFGTESAARHHRALDTLGHIASRGVDPRVHSPAPLKPVLDDVRRVVDSHPSVAADPRPQRADGSLSGVRLLRTSSALQSDVEVRSDAEVPGGRDGSAELAASLRLRSLTGLEETMANVAVPTGKLRAGPSRGPSRGRRRSRSGGPALRRSAGRRAPRARTAVLSGALVLALGASALAVVALSGPSAPKTARPSARRSPTGATATSPSRPAANSPPPVPTTEAPASASLVSKNASSATYAIVGSPTITLSGSGPCWMELRRGDASGAVVFVGILASGQHQSVTGPAWVRLGNPAAISIQVGATTLVPPSSAPGVPYNLVFQ